MIDVRLPAISAALLVASLSPIQADQAKPAVSQECAASQACRAPGVNDMMVATQLRHFKLWYAGLVQNWRLASYELTQIRASIEETKAIYKKSGPSSMAMMSPTTDQLEDAIKAEDPVKFETAFGKLTATCNACHEQTGFGFIKMRVPKLSPLETSPLSDEDFSVR